MFYLRLRQDGEKLRVHLDVLPEIKTRWRVGKGSLGCSA